MNFLPREEKFFTQFNDQTRVIAEAASVLLDGVTHGNSRLQSMAPRISQMEREGDEIVHGIFKRLNQTFITPLDPEDIHSVCSHLDDVLDGIEEVAHRLVAYKVDPIPEPVVRVCEYVKLCSDQLTLAISQLDGDRAILPSCIEINRLEEQVDDVVRRAIADLFENEPNPITVIKLKEIYDYLEATVDACEDVADALQTVVVKNS